VIGTIARRKNLKFAAAVAAAVLLSLGRECQAQDLIPTDFALDFESIPAGGPGHPAQDLIPTHFPLGPYPFILLASERPAFLLAIIASLLAGWALLCWRVPEVDGLANLWRCLVMYILCRATETGVMFLAWPHVDLIGWHGNRAERYLQAAALLGMSSTVVFGLMLLLYWRVGWRRKLPLAFGFTLVGYAAAVIVLLVFGEWGALNLAI